MSGCSVFFGVSLHSSGKWLQCVSWFWLTKRRWKVGPSIAQCPKHHPLVWRFFVAPVPGHRVEEWRVYQSYIVMVSGVLSLIPLFLWEIDPLYGIAVSSLKKWMLEVVVAEWGCKFLYVVFGLAEIGSLEDSSYTMLRINFYWSWCFPLPLHALQSPSYSDTDVTGGIHLIQHCDQIKCGLWV